MKLILRRDLGGVSSILLMAGVIFLLDGYSGSSFGGRGDNVGHICTKGGGGIAPSWASKLGIPLANPRFYPPSSSADIVHRCRGEI